MSIPNKSNFKFQELTPITGVKPYVLRFWETEFHEINPISSEKGEKIYARSDVEAILRIKKLLFEDKLSIPEAKLCIQQGNDLPPDEVPMATGVSPEARSSVVEALEFIRALKSKRGW
jgi:DNA-binding transcriptional MerR regulator